MVLQRIARCVAVALLLLASAGFAQEREQEPAPERSTLLDVRALAGSYVTTLTKDDLRAQNFYIDKDLVGTWTVQIEEDGHVHWSYLGPGGERSYTLTGVYVLHRGELVLGAEEGPYACRDLYGVTSGAYRYEPSVDALRLTVVEDACIERRIILTAHPLQPSPPD